MEKSNIFYQCPTCAISFENKDKYITHLKNEHMEIKYICDTCPEKFPNRAMYLQHNINFHKHLYCEKCDFDYPPIEKHSCGEKIFNFTCSFGNCRQKVYTRLNFFLRHLQTEHKINDYNSIKYMIEHCSRETIKPYKNSLLKMKRSKKIKKNEDHSSFISKESTSKQINDDNNRKTSSFLLKSSSNLFENQKSICELNNQLENNKMLNEHSIIAQK